MKLIVLNETAYDEDELEKAGVQFAMYYYETDGYEGSGICIAFKDNLWYTYNISHCSCNSPFEDFDLKEPFTKLKDAIRSFHSNDWSRYFDFTIDAIHEEVKVYQKKTLFSGAESVYIYLKEVF